MGALTLKSFPFILRSWNVKSYDSIDPTDSFGQDTKVYVNKNQVVKIEPQFSNNTGPFWLTDKGRQFFDSIFGKISRNSSQLEDLPGKTIGQWEALFKNISTTFYVFDICNFKNVKKHFFIIVFENVNIEILNFLSLISQKHSFIKVRRAENLKVNADLEINFQINSATSSSKLGVSSLGLLIGVNPRYEGSHLNLKLRQRYFKGNFKLLSIGSLLNLTFPVSFLGSNLSILKSIAEGNQTACKDIVNANNPTIITNTETFKHNNAQELVNCFKVLNHANILTKVWNGYNVLNSSLYETGIYSSVRFSSLTLKDLLSFSSLYLINVDLNNIVHLKKIAESRLLNYKSSHVLSNKKLLLNQNFQASTLRVSKHITFGKCLYLPNNIFFENQESFINTEGSIKRTTRLISRKNMKNDWQLLRKFVKSFRSNATLSDIKNNKIVSYNSKTLFGFKNFMNFQFYATQTLTNLNFYLNTKNQKFTIYEKFNRFKNSPMKLVSTKLKYWLDDFYTGGKDTFCSNSLLLTKCSMNYRLQMTNFF